MTTSLKIRVSAFAVTLFTLWAIASTNAGDPPESPNLLPPVPWAEMAQLKKPDNLMAGIGNAPAAPKPKTVSWWTDFSVSPYVAWKHPDFTGKPIVGAGIGFGYQINRVVGVHVLNSLFDEPDTQGHDAFGRPCVVEENGWTSGTGIDETEGVARADLIKAGGKGNDRFVGFLLGSYTHSWEHDDEAIGVGAGFDIRMAKNFALETTYRIRSFFDHGEEGIGMFGLHFQW
jgi:hypothetical protein